MCTTRLIAYTDGSCAPNPGKGGWGFIAIDGDVEIHISGGKAYTTNNVMELTAVIELLETFSTTTRFYIYSDSQYVINCAKGKWKRHKNAQLWKRYGVCAMGKDIKWKWVKGHSGDHYNELVDKLAKSEVF